MNRPLSLILLIVITFSCQSNIDKNSIEKNLDNSLKVDNFNIPIDSNQFYYPLELFTDTMLYVGYDTLHVQWYSNHLRTLIEPLLFNKKTDREIYRFLWLRTFHNPVLIRIEKNNRDFKLFWKLTNGAGGYKPGNLILNKERKITESDWNSFLKLIDISNFWEMKTVKVDIPGNDGSQWILEAQSNGKYHVVDRWTPRQGDFYNCCDFLIKLTDLNIEKKDKY